MLVGKVISDTVGGSGGEDRRLDGRDSMNRGREQKIPADCVGMRLKNNVGEGFTVVCRYGDGFKVQFDGYLQEVRASLRGIRRGQVRNPYKVTVAGLGWLGEAAGHRDGEELRSYRVWKNMLVYAARKGKTVRVCEEWLEFAKFKRWFDSHQHDGTVFTVTLDSFQIGSKQRVYSPASCMFVPHKLKAALHRGFTGGSLMHRLKRLRAIGDKWLGEAGGLQERTWYQLQRYLLMQLDAIKREVELVDVEI
jgi:hypothetical protein